MKTSQVDIPTNVITEQIIGCAYRVSNTLGCGFLEKVYENALAHELNKINLKVNQQCPIKVWYDNIIVGDFIADLVVQNRVIIELKTAARLDNVHIAQCLNYLRATRLDVCLLLNFGKPKLEIKRLMN